jgi:chromate transporter
MPEMNVGFLEMTRTLFRIGATSYGGPAIVADIRRVTVQQRGWVSEDEFRESLGLAQMLPGPVAVNTCAHIGYRLHGPAGLLAALVSYTSPAFILMLALSAAYFHFETLPLVAAAFRGLGPAVVAILVESLLSMTPAALRDWCGVAVAALAAGLLFADVETLLVLLVAVGVAILAGRIRKRSPDTATRAPAQHTPRPDLVWLLGAAGALALMIAGSALLSPRLPLVGITMAKIDLLAYGGGYTAIALMFREVVQSHAWMSARQLIDGLALGQITPGPVMITATFIGYHAAGIGGAVLGTTCIFLPSALVLLAVAPHFARIRHLPAVADAVCGLLAAFIAMLLHVLAGVARTSLTGWWELALAAVAVVALRMRVSVVWVVLAAIAAGLVLMR